MKGRSLIILAGLSLAGCQENGPPRSAGRVAPPPTMREAGLSDDSISILLSRDLGKVKAALEEELPGRDFILFMIIF